MTKLQAKSKEQIKFVTPAQYERGHKAMVAAGKEEVFMMVGSVERMQSVLDMLREKPSMTLSDVADAIGAHEVLGAQENLTRPSLAPRSGSAKEAAPTDKDLKSMARYAKRDKFSKSKRK